jgi:2,3,4,5-tetrahydropyridine-2-carboxylate N-succinyltransferase
MIALKNIIETAWDNRALLQEENTITAIREVIGLLDSGNSASCRTNFGWMASE